MSTVLEVILTVVVVVVLGSLIGRIVRWLKLEKWHLTVLGAVGFSLLLIGASIPGVVLLCFASGGFFYMYFLGGAHKAQSTQREEAKAQTHMAIQVLESIDKHPNCILSDIEQELPSVAVSHPQSLIEILESMKDNSLIEAEGRTGSLRVDKETRLRITQAGIEFLMSNRG